MTDENPVSETDTQDVTHREDESIDELLYKANEHLHAIEDIRQTIEKHSEELLTLRDAAEKNSQSASASLEEIKKSVESASENVKASQEQKNTIDQLLNSTKAEIEKKRDDAITLLETIKKHEANAKLIADTANEKDARVQEFEKQLNEQNKKYLDIYNKIENLLPGATSASLASAFERRKLTFMKPKIFWGILQIGAVILLIGAGYWIFSKVEIQDLGDLIFFILKRSPIIAAIILLEEIARRNRNIALRIEEDYGYKEVLSRSFEGYKKQMSDIIETSGGAVSTLSNNLLNAMAKEPGRLIDKEKPVIKPSSDIIEDIKDMAKKKE